MPRLKYRAAAALALAGIIAACDTGGRDGDPNYFVGPGQPGLGQLNVFVSDAPPDFSALRAVNIAIERIEAIGVLGSEQAVVTLFDATRTTPITNPLLDTPQQINGQGLPNTGPQLGPQRVDLFALRGGPMAQVASVLLPPGRIDRVRVFISSADVSLAGLNGTTPDLYSTANGRLTLGALTPDQPLVATITSAVFIAPGIEQGILLDFDLARSLTAVGDPAAPSQIVFTPVVVARPLTQNSVGGVIRTDNGTPNDPTDDRPVQNALVSLVDDADQTIAVTTTDSQGVFSLVGVPIGTMVMLVDAANHSATTVPITVTGGRFTNDLLLAAALVQQQQ